MNSIAARSCGHACHVGLMLGASISGSLGLLVGLLAGRWLLSLGPDFDPDDYEDPTAPLFILGAIASAMLGVSVALLGFMFGRRGLPWVAVGFTLLLAFQVVRSLVAANYVSLAFELTVGLGGLPGGLYGSFCGIRLYQRRMGRLTVRI